MGEPCACALPRKRPVYKQWLRLRFRFWNWLQRLSKQRVDNLWAIVRERRMAADRVRFDREAHHTGWEPCPNTRGS